ncbi:penicillin-binding protein 1A [Mariniphaga anaerophila]|uniref:Penicillin-binding protein 1A n=1 Tax=Mariniphaga anaerophila TaxID=1484053 RepID=A0A1M4YMU1_9BACT|nr:transglycosylase domain-containing protein [Mariniphaga anaerophila]SHF07100.1 penicillin-binding protein 1A [Mariniphaga anaerophila]
MVAKKAKNKKPVKRKPRKSTKRKTKKNGKNRLFIFILWLIAAGILAFSVLFVVVFLGYTGHVPTSAQLIEIKNPQASEVISEDGKLLGRYYTENRSNVSFDEISPNVIHALIATEDARFYEHRGIDEIALMRVLVKTILLRDRSAGGGSTLSQQVAKNLFPRNDVGILSMPVNKLREAIIAYRLERIYTKEEILTLYLNTVPFGENIFGIEVASERYFSKNPKNLTVDEAAVLVGMLKANSAYNPRLNPERSEARRNVVISLMVTNGYLTEEEGQKFKEKPLRIKYTRISFNEGPAPYFVEMLKPELLDWCANNTKENGEHWNLYTDGLRIATTLNADYQYYARQSVTEHMKNLQGIFDKHWSNADPWRRNPSILKRAVQRTDRYKQMKKAGFSQEQIDKAFNDEITASLFTWNGIEQVKTTPLDSVKHYLRLLNTGFLALNPKNGDLKAWVGGIDFRFFKYDHVLSQRQVGSTFKPFVYLSALENGLSPFDYFPATQKVYEEYDNWSPANSGGHSDGYYSMEGALSRSINTVAVDVLMQTGIDNIVSTARELGLEADLPKVPSLALGVTSISLKDLLFAYATMLNGGTKVEPYYLCSISSADGKLLAEFERPATQKGQLNEVNCRIIMHMMETAINEGTGTKIRSSYRIHGDFAGKTGTTQNNSDGWFVGLTPNLVTGCWTGAEDPGVHFRTTTYGQGAFAALPIVGKFFNKLYNDPRYKKLQAARFPNLDQELLADLNIPRYKEILEIEKPDNLLDRIFTGKSKEEKLREIQQPESAETKKGLWQSLKGIFKKKKK